MEHQLLDSPETFDAWIHSETDELYGDFLARHALVVREKHELAVRAAAPLSVKDAIWNAWCEEAHPQEWWGETKHYAAEVKRAWWVWIGYVTWNGIKNLFETMVYSWLFGNGH